MNLKEFIKPNLTKIIIALILFILIVPFIVHDNGVRCITAPCDSETTSSIPFYLLADYKKFYEINYLALFSGLIIEYLVACIIAIPLRKSKN